MRRLNLSGELEALLQAGSGFQRDYLTHRPHGNYEAAHLLMTRSTEWSALRAWGMRSTAANSAGASKPPHQHRLHDGRRSSFRLVRAQPRRVTGDAVASPYV